MYNCCLRCWLNITVSWGPASLVGKRNRSSTSPLSAVSGKEVSYLLHCSRKEGMGRRAKEWEGGLLFPHAIMALHHLAFIVHYQKSAMLSHAQWGKSNKTIIWSIIVTFKPRSLRQCCTRALSKLKRNFTVEIETADSNTVVVLL